MKDDKKHDVVPLTAGSVPAVNDYGEYAGIGTGDGGAAAMMIPFVNLLQANSPQVSSEDPPAAKQGAFYNTATQEVIPGAVGFVFQPCYEEELWVEWLPREKGGGGGAGFVASYKPDDEFVKLTLKGDRRDEKKKLLTKDGNHLVQTFYVYGYVLDQKGEEQQGLCVQGFTSTKIKHYRGWYTARHCIKNAGNIPIFAHRVVVTSKQEEKNGQKFWNVRFSPFAKDEKGAPSWKASLLPSGHPRLEEGNGLRTMITSGKAKADHNAQDVASEPGADETKVPF